jgi:hypothetical protein
MPYVFGETQQGEKRSASTFPSLPSEVLTETFAQTYEENPIASVNRARELRNDFQAGPTIAADTARQKLKDAGMEGHLTVSDAGITQAALDTLMFRKRIELKRQEVFRQAPDSNWLKAGQLGVGLATSLIDPVNVLSGFVPVIGEAKYARMLGKAGGMLGRTGVRAGVGAVEGLAGAAMVEPIIYGSRRYEQADYDMSDSLLNVAFGGLFGAGLHTVGGAISDGLRHYSGDAPSAARVRVDALTQEARTRIEPTVDGIRAPDAPERIRDPVPEPGSAAARVAEQSPVVREQTLKQAVVQAVSGEPISVDRMIAPQTETPAFKQWFGKSKVVDDAGQPLRVYHGTAIDLDRFDIEGMSGVNFKESEGFAFFTDKPDAYPSSASDYARQAAGKHPGANVIPAFVKLENPLIVNADGHYNAVAAFDKQAAKIREQVKAGNHDGVIVRYSDGHGDRLIAATRPEQIKSAIGNSGRFDPSSSSLTDAIDPEDTAELPGLIDHAEEVLARETDTGTPTADNLKMATEEYDLAASDLQSLADRLGMEAEDADVTAVNDAAKMSERWAKAAELATVCLMRGG